MPRVVNCLALGAAGALFYGAVIERNAFALRRFDVPVLPPGTPPIRLLHISDLHLTPPQRRKQAWITGLAELRPDLVINTGDTLSAVNGIPAVLRTLDPLFAFPGGFVPGNNDYYVPRPKNPVRYFTKQVPQPRTPNLPWPELARAMGAAGWLDLTHRRARLCAHGLPVALAGTDDPHLRRARYELVAGPADAEAVVRIGVIHSPEPYLLEAFAADGYDLVLAGHTHGGQIRVPFGPAIVTNCDIDVHRARWLHRWDERMWFHVCAGVGTNPYMPIRFGCRPEASLLTLVPRT
jgi:predicted MPP superfamily phosphohydrolase